MSHVRAKFFVRSVAQEASNAGSAAQCGTVILVPVYGDSPENKTWSQYTPQGEMKMTITNPKALAEFQPGQAFYIDFTPAEPPPT